MKIDKVEKLLQKLFDAGFTNEIPAIQLKRKIAAYSGETSTSKINTIIKDLIDLQIIELRDYSYFFTTDGLLFINRPQQGNLAQKEDPLK